MSLCQQLVRLLRFRNLIAVTFILILLYMIKFSHDNLMKSFLGKKESEHFVPRSLKKIDWHNYTQIAEEKERVGLGEQGQPATLPEGYETLAKELYAVNGFNGALSDLIPLNRSLKDIRHPKCKDRMYIESLPTVSVVVPFHNEHWSTLLRTARTVLHRSPAHLIKEVFLVDDASTKVFLKEELEEYVQTHMPKVHVVRLGVRSGLITARLAGAKRASGDVLVFLDSHSEANVNWLPPLLEPIALNYRVAVCPFIDVVAFDTLEYRAQDEGARGAFDWELFYKRLPLLPKDRENMPEPFESPVMAGGLFAISRAFFWELGGYDPGLDIWGGEQYELSFKIWQCGGRILDAPCSRVGRICRKFEPFPYPQHEDLVEKNYRRVAEVWMDEFAEYVYARRPHYRAIDPGDLAEQRAVRDRMRCKPFRWFITQIAFDLPVRYPMVVPKPFAEGQIKPYEQPSYCLDMHNGRQMDRLTLAHCSDDSSAEQQFELTWHKDSVRSESRSMCWDVPDSSPGAPVLLYSCNLDTNHLEHSSQKCLDYDKTTLEVSVSKCDNASSTQKWSIETIHPDSMALWDKITERVTGPVVPWTE